MRETRMTDACHGKSSALLQRSLSPKMYHLFRVWQAWVNKFHLEIGVTEWILAQGSEPKGNQFLIFPPNPPCGVGLPWSVQPADRGTPKVIRLSVVIRLRTAQGDCRSAGGARVTGLIRESDHPGSNVEVQWELLEHHNTVHRNDPKH